jgi:hypothetical protein
MSRYRDLERRFERLRRARGGREGLVFLAGGATRAVRCADPLLLFIAMCDRIYFGKGDVPHGNEGERRYGPLLDILQGENVESFKSSDRFFQNVADQAVFEFKKEGDVPLCQRKIQ